MTTTKNQAIQKALSGDWNSAIQLNVEALKEEPKDIETLNRLAFAYAIIGKIKDAKSTYQKVITLDRLNPIALKNLKRLNADKASNFSSNQTLFSTRPLDTLFLEENGKTKIIDLVNIAEPKIIAHLITGEIVELRIKRLKIFVLDGQGKYIGVLPDNISKRLIKFVKGGNVYEAYIKSCDKSRVSIFIREIKRVVKFKNQPSFVVADKTFFVLSKTHAPKLKDDLDDDEEEEDDTL